MQLAVQRPVYLVPVIPPSLPIYFLRRMKHFGATHLDEVLCVEARGYRLPDGMSVYIFLAMDAVSLHAHHHELRVTNTLDDHLAFIRLLPGRCPMPKGMTLASSLPALHQAQLAAAFPQFGKVLCDAEGVARVTKEFHAGFAKQTGLRPMER